MVGSSSVSIYAMLFRFMCRAFTIGETPNPLYASLVAMPLTWLIATLCASVPAHFFLQWRRSLGEQGDGVEAVGNITPESLSADGQQQLEAGSPSPGQTAVEMLKGSVRRQEL